LPAGAATPRASQAVTVTLIRVILAPTAGLVGASVATLAYVAVPTMLERGYKTSFATGSIAVAGTLALILPPAITLYFLADELGVLISHMFLSTLVSGRGAGCRARGGAQFVQQLLTGKVVPVPIGYPPP